MKGLIHDLQSTSGPRGGSVPQRLRRSIGLCVTAHSEVPEQIFRPRAALVSNVGFGLERVTFR